MKKEFRFWCTKGISVDYMKVNIKQAQGELERHGLGEGAIVDIIVGDGYGRYIPQILFSKLGVYTSEDVYPFEIGSEEEILAFDELLEEVDEELQELVEEFDLVPTGFAIQFGWYDGGICTMLYTIS